jgi:putrescine aminotransferase
MGARLQARLHNPSDHPLVGDVRRRGMLAAIELLTNKAKKTPLPAESVPAVQLFDRAWDNNLMLRAFPWGVLGYAPALCCTADQIDQIVERTRVVLDLTLEDPDIRAAMA